LGYSQIPGVDFSDNYAPVGNDITFRVTMVLRLIYNLHAVLLDVKTAFLYGKLEEEIYMEIPTGYKEVYADPGNDKVFVLKMAMYGLVQAARQWFKRLRDGLITLVFNPCESDPCLMYRIDEEGVCIILMYKDDNFIVVVRNIPEAVFILDQDQKLYKSGVGMLLFLVKHTRPDLSNSTRELSKVMDKAMEGHMKELCRVIKYAINTKNKGLKLRPEDTCRRQRNTNKCYMIYYLFHECTNLLALTWTERGYIIHNRSRIRSVQ